MKSILVIEDDQTLAKGIALSLASAEITIDQAHTLKQARQQMKNASYQLILLDVNLPDGNGLAFCSEIKAKRQIPVILLTARDLELDVVSGFAAGADDYVTKPFSLAILRARVEALLKRYAEISRRDGAYTFADASFDFQRQSFTLAQQEVLFSKIEQQVLRMFLENPGITLTREALSQQAWGLEAEFVEENALSVVIKRLRTKLQEVPRLNIKTIYGIGYRWEVLDD